MQNNGEYGAVIEANNNAVAFVDRSMGRMHTFYLSGYVDSPDKYVSWFETIRNAQEHDIVCIHINSPGGDAFTAVQFMRIMRETKANVVASVEGACMSAATLIFLAAKHWEISEHSVFMFHDYSSWSVGKGGEMYDELTHFRKWSNKLWKDAYGDFLTEEEIAQILDNKDIWMDSHEVAERLNRMSEVAKENAETLNNIPAPKSKTTTKTPAKKKTTRAKKTSASTVRQKKAILR